MRLSDIRSMLAQSTPDEWNKIDCWGAVSGPSYKDRIVSWKSGDGPVATAVESHSNVAIFREDVNLSIAWGLDRDGYWDSGHGRELSFDFQDNFPDSRVTILLMDVFWAGNLVDRHYIMSVDGGRAYLPLTNTRKIASNPDEYEQYFPEDMLPIVRLLHDFEHTESFDNYVRQSQVPVRPREV